MTKKEIATVLKNVTDVITRKEKGIVIVGRPHKGGVLSTVVGECPLSVVATVIDDIINKHPEVMQAIIALKVSEIAERKAGAVIVHGKTSGRIKVAAKPAAKKVSSKKK